MQTSIIQTTTRPILKKYLRSSTRGRSGQSCEPQPDCCGRLSKVPKRNAEEPFIERNCFPDIFSNWKPKIPKLCPAECVETLETPCIVKRKCCAGMKAPPSVAEIKNKAKECQKVNDPEAVHKKLKKPEVIILSTWSQVQKNKHIFLTDFAYNVLRIKRPPTRRIKCQCRRCPNHCKHLKNKFN